MNAQPVVIIFDVHQSKPVDHFRSGFGGAALQRGGGKADGRSPVCRGSWIFQRTARQRRAPAGHVRRLFRRRHPGLSGEGLEPLYYRAALQHIREHPGWWLRLLARKAFYTVVPIGPSYALHSARYRAASIVPYVLLLPFAVAGAVRLRHAAHPPAALFLLAGSAVLVCLVFFPQERFRIPVIDPALIVCAAAAGAHYRR